MGKVNDQNNSLQIKFKFSKKEVPFTYPKIFILFLVLCNWNFENIQQNSVPVRLRDHSKLAIKNAFESIIIERN